MRAPIFWKAAVIALKTCKGSNDGLPETISVEAPENIRAVYLPPKRKLFRSDLPTQLTFRCKLAVRGRENGYFHISHMLFKEMIRSHGGNLTLRFQCQPQKPPWKQVMDLILTARLNKKQWDLTSKTNALVMWVMWYLCGQRGNLQFEGSLAQLKNAAAIETIKVAHLKTPPGS